MKRLLSRWIFAVVFASTALVGCGDSTPTTSTTTCSPVCSAGYTCAGNLCVALCNPSCSAGETCRVRAGGTVCEIGSDNDAGSDIGETRDVLQPPGDMVTPSDMTMTGDTVAPPPDVPVTPPGDAGDGGATRPPCGMAGMACCANPTGSASPPYRYCFGASLCNETTMRCDAYTPEPNECTATARCEAGNVCSGFFSCGPRNCFRCSPRGSGAAIGGACGTGMPCAEGVCWDGFCRAPCAYGGDGDAQCRARDPRSICTEFALGSSSDGGPGPAVPAGICTPSCTRNADCPTGTTCRMLFDNARDSLVLVCRQSFGTIAPGGSCPRSPTSDTDRTMYCQNDQCLTQTGASEGYCSSFCSTDADCPGAMYQCTDVRFRRPSRIEPGVPFRWCTRR
jgi:hypothetical protein